MLVVISDLHLVDGTAGDHNVKSEAFELWMDEVLTIAEDKDAASLDFLYLGDIFDLIRTEKWFEVELADRPWGDPAINDHPGQLGTACAEKAREILEAIAAETTGHCDVLSGRGPAELRKRLERFAAGGKPVRRAFIPGNHARLYCVVPQIRQRIDELLGIGGPFVGDLTLHRLQSRADGLLARHGHELDVWNFEGFKADAGRFEFADIDYLKVPIGDPITTELVARLPHAIKRHLETSGPPMRRSVIDGVYERLQNIENVRPVAAAIQWISYEAAEMKKSAIAPGMVAGSWQDDERERVVEAVETITARLFNEFMELPFVKEWLRVHDSWSDPWDAADKLQALGLLLRRGIDVDKISPLMEAYKRLGIGESDEQRRAALFEPALDDPAADIHYVAYGHTHQFQQAALRKTADHEKIYFNSGTWRPRFSRADNGIDFVKWKEMTYLVFYGANEDKLRGSDRYKGVSFETWTGTMLKRDRQEPKPAP